MSANIEVHAIPYNQAQPTTIILTPKFLKKFIITKLKIIIVMRDTFLKLQTSNRRSNRSNHKIACYESNVNI